MNYSELDLNLLKIFVVVAQNNSILRASEKLFISQPAVSTSIKRLENLLGGKLFLRTSKGVMLTDEGRILYDYSVEALNKIDAGLNIFNDFVSLNCGNIKIGSGSTAIRYMILPFINFFSNKYPKITISITDGNSEELQDYLLKTQVDLSITSLPISKSNLFDVTKIFETTDCFVAGNKYADLRGKIIKGNDIKKYPLILQKLPSNNRELFDEMCSANKIELAPTFEMSSFNLIADFAINNMGIGFTIKEFMKSYFDSEKLFEVKTDLLLPRQTFVAITLKDRYTTSLTKKFIEEMTQYFSK